MRMLVLTRKKNESIIINDDITIVVVEIRGDKVRLGVECPKEVPVHRHEVYEAIRRHMLKAGTNEDLESTSSNAPPSPSPREANASDSVRPVSKARQDAISKLGDLLKTRRNALRKALAGDLSLLNQLREQSGGDIVDAALDAAQNEISSQLAEVESRELANIEQALRRMKKGTYGNCVVCGSQIALARLNALPYATTCLDCQRLVELDSATASPIGEWSRVGANYDLPTEPDVAPPAAPRKPQRPKAKRKPSRKTQTRKSASPTKSDSKKRRSLRGKLGSLFSGLVKKLKADESLEAKAKSAKKSAKPKTAKKKAKGKPK
jgi:DnaK suppressor protein